MVFPCSGYHWCSAKASCKVLMVQKVSKAKHFILKGVEGKCVKMRLCFEGFDEKVSKVKHVCHSKCCVQMC